MPIEEPLYALPGTESRDNPRYRKGYYRWLDRRAVEIDVVLWQAPDGNIHPVEAHMICPYCAHPITTRVTAQTVEVDDEHNLTLLVPLACPGHWRAVENGVPVVHPQTGAPVWVRCNWQGMVLRGKAHYCEVTRTPQGVALNPQRSCPAVTGQGPCSCEPFYRGAFQ